MRKLFVFITIVGLLIWGVPKLFAAEGNIGVAINSEHIAVGDCVKSSDPYDEVSCDSDNAAYIITSETDSIGSNCDTTTDYGYIETSYSQGGTVYHCVRSLY